MISHVRTSIALAAAAAAFLFWSSSASGGRYSEIEDLLRSGNFQLATEQLDRVVGSDFIDAEGFYHYSRLEIRGEIALEHLRKSLNLCDDTDCSPTLAELADALYTSGEYERVIQLFDKYSKKIAISHAGFEFYWFAAMSRMRNGDFKDAEKTFKKIEKKFDTARYSSWGILGRGLANDGAGKTKDASSRFRSLTASGGEISALALYNESIVAAESGRREDALHGYNLLDIRFDDFIGSAELAYLILDKDRPPASGDAEQLADVTYTIEMGLFREREEADKLYGRLKAGKWSVRLDRRRIADRSYWAVQVGIFRSRESADETRKKLESLIPGNYRVVLR